MHDFPPFINVDPSKFSSYNVGVGGGRGEVINRYMSCLRALHAKISFPRRRYSSSGACRELLRVGTADFLLHLYCS